MEPTTIGSAELPDESCRTQDLVGLGHLIARLFEIERVGVSFRCSSTVRWRLGSYRSRDLEEITRQLAPEALSVPQTSDVNKAIFRFQELAESRPWKKARTAWVGTQSEDTDAPQTLGMSVYAAVDGANQELPLDSLRWRPVSRYLAEVMDRSNEKPILSEPMQRWQSKADHRALLDRGLDSTWYQFVAERGALIAGERATLAEAGFEVDDRWFDRELERARDARSRLLAVQMISSSELTDQSPQLDGFHIWTLCRLGLLLGVMDHGTLWLPQFQFLESSALPHPAIPIINTVIGLDSPSWAALSWWLTPLDPGTIGSRARSPAVSLRQDWKKLLMSVAVTVAGLE